MVSHIVLLKCRTDIPHSQLQQMFTALHDLVNIVPGLQLCTSGPNNSPEEINRGYSHGFYMQFNDLKSRDEYLDHPAHEKVKVLIGAVLEDVESNVLVLDY